MEMPPEADRTVGLDEKAAEGGYPIAAPIGYQNVDDDIGNHAPPPTRPYDRPGLLARTNHSLAARAR